MEVPRKLNFFPAKGGISQYYSPQAILHHRAVDYSTQCAIPTLAYVLAHEENHPTNTQSARGVDCIYLRPFNNSQGGHEVYSLQTKEVLIRRRVTEMPPTQAIIDRVHEIAISEGMKQLRFTSFSSIAGVDQPTIPGVPNNEENGDMPPLAPTNEDDSDSESEYDSEEEMEGNAYPEDDDPYQGDDPPSMNLVDGQGGQDGQDDPIEDNEPQVPEEQSEASGQSQSSDDDGSVGEEIPHHYQPTLRRSVRVPPVEE